MKVKDLEPVLQETKEQIRTELINEFEQKLRGISFDEKISNPRTVMLICVAQLRSMLPSETPEKIAERKAEQEWFNWCDKKGYHINSPMLKDEFVKLRIEALLTDIKK